MKCTSLIISCLAFVLTYSPATAQTVQANVTAPIIATTNSQLKSTTLSQELGKSFLDAPISASGNGYFIATHSVVGIPPTITAPEHLRHVMTGNHGDPSGMNPYATQYWVKSTCQRGSPSSKFCVNQTSGSHAFTSFAAGLTDVVSLYFTSIYNAGGGDRLAFIHEENAGNTGFAPPADSKNWVGQVRIGLAYSADFGNTWRYLGRVAQPYARSDGTCPTSGFNMQGTPYVVINGFFYIWYRDINKTTCGGYAVSRAKVSDVLSAAKVGNSGLGNNLWEKRINITGTPSSVVGWSKNIAAEPYFSTTMPEGVIHSQAIQTKYLDINGANVDKYYGATTIMTHGGWESLHSYVRLYEISPQTLDWSFNMSVANELSASFTATNEAGYQYASLVDPAGGANGITGSSFYIYSGKIQKEFPTVNGPDQVLYQWEINLKTPPRFFKLSKDFSSFPGLNGWNYSTLNMGNMSFIQEPNSNRWQHPSDTWNRIFNNGMSAGQNDGFLLTWTAPATGRIAVRQTARISQPCGAGTDGVYVAAQHNSTVFFNGLVTAEDTNGIGSLKILNVVAGDNLYFYGTKGGNHFCDNLYWDPSILYQ